MITIYDWFGYELPIKERYQLIKKVGFDGILLWWSEGFGRNDYRNAPQIVWDAGLFIENIHTPVHNQNDLWLDNLDGEALSDCYNNVLQIAMSLRYRLWLCTCPAKIIHITH
ncbi:hypothetical protein [Lacrimispora celerecrescens]|uniref:hypothetical protein n=1 Tax=Lacrimispora celerecrescens TaxID=29354 RepID=UPI001FA7EFC9|nr:hypothetical protein [Lacrimispora celerecrescens]